MALELQHQPMPFGMEIRTTRAAPPWVTRDVTLSVNVFGKHKAASWDASNFTVACFEFSLPVKRGQHAPFVRLIRRH
jgi:hypothetical protein